MNGWMDERMELLIVSSNTLPVPVDPVNDSILTRRLPTTASVTSSTLSREQEIVFITPSGIPASSANCNKTHHFN